jgi:hypothetical protein
VWDGTHGPKKTISASLLLDSAGDLVHVRSGVYRETATVSVSGAAVSAIEYRGDYQGLIWPGGGVVRITGSDDDKTATRANCIAVGAHAYRTFTGFLLDGATTQLITGTNTNVTIQQCALHSSAVGGANGVIEITGANQSTWTIQNCMFNGGSMGGVRMTHSAEVTTSAHLIQNCVFVGLRAGAYCSAVGGQTVKNCLMLGCTVNGIQATGIASSTMTVNNCLVMNCATGLIGQDAADITADYINVSGCTTARTNVNTGAHDLAYIPLLDSHWFFEMVNGGRMVTPFDLSAWSQLINLAGTSPPTTDMRGTAVQGAQREWGPLECDSTLLIESAAGGGLLQANKRGNKQ